MGEARRPRQGIRNERRIHSSHRRSPVPRRRLGLEYPPRDPLQRPTPQISARDSRIRSRSNVPQRPPETRHGKMQEWLRGEVDLAWLIDADTQTVYIYRAGRTEPEQQANLTPLPGEGPIA